MDGSRRIHQLPASLVNRIAAGEVIERPASVVKELVENSIDAGANHIIVEIEDGGREVIRVIDDGCGIPPEDLPLAFAQHATSKLTCDDDLFAIQTMGFRGEALASIGAVSHAKITSRTRDRDEAYEITNRGGLVSDPQAAPGNVGTTIEIRNLFFNTPARRKFLKGTSTEAGHISDTLLRLALPHPGISFKLISGSRTSLDLPAATAEERLLAAWPDSFREQRLPIDVRDAELRLWGLIGLPETATPTAKYQYLYLNGRHIRDRFLGHAMKEAYRGLTEPGRQPAAILLLTIPPGDVDVNVHPTKSEVRFRDSGRMHGLVLSAMRERLLGSDLTPNAVAMQADDGHRESMRDKLASFLRQVADAEGTEARRHEGTKGGEDCGLRIADCGLQTPNPQSEIRNPQFASPETRSPIPDTRFTPVPDHELRHVAAELIGTGARLLGAGAKPPAMQLHNTYLVTENDDGLMIIDQHALHERIMYEELLARLSRGNLESQHMLIPPVVRASQRQIGLLEQIQPLLRKLGIEIAPFGPDSVAVHAFPTFLSKLDPERFVTELLEKGEQELLDLHQEAVLHELLDMMACKAAVKAGDPLTPEEIDALLARKDLVARSSNCPHGRPTTLRLTLRELEKQFKRTGF